jgi:hypothetical protein
MGPVKMCPLMHGTVFTDPYPDGYIHGKNPAICPKGCLPSVNPDKGMDHLEVLVRDAKEYIEIYHHEHNSPPAVK